MSQKDFYCSFPWRHLHYGQSAGRQPCCRSDDRFSTPISSGESESLNSSDRRAFRLQLLAGQVPPGCAKCEREETNQMVSLRQTANKMFEHEPRPRDPEVQPRDIKYLEYFLGTNCNLKCLMCNAESSSKWNEDYEALGWTIPAPALNRLSLSDLLDQFTSVNFLKLVGGETLMYRDAARTLLSRPEILGELSLSLYTNATVPPSSEWLEVFARAKSVELNLSIDGIGELNDYLRFPARWNSVLKNLPAFWSAQTENPRLNLRLQAVVSVLNVEGVAALFDWWQDQWLRNSRRAFRADSDLKLVPISNPNFLRLENTPLELRQKIAVTLERIPYHGKVLPNFLRGRQPPPLLAELREYLRRLDARRGVELKNVNPALALSL